MIASSSPPPPFDGGPWQPVHGGDINHAARVVLEDGTPAFLKWHDAAPPGMFAAERAGLQLLRSAIGDAVPDVLAWADGWLLIEWIECGPPGPASEEALGELIASLHGRTEKRFGLEQDNFLGPLPQTNDWCQSWPEFWMVRRIEPLLQRARDTEVLDAPECERVHRAAGKVAAACPNEPARLVHGDLWAGNTLIDAGGRPRLVDPAPAYCHRETELAMMLLFGGFGPAVWERYDDLLPIADGFEQRAEGLQLQPLLVHALLFGGAYRQRVLDAASRWL